MGRVSRRIRTPQRRLAARSRYGKQGHRADYSQLRGANIRLASAQKALTIHNKTVAQNQQVADFYTSRFSNIALYTWLATTMQTTYRTGYTSAYAMAKLAEQAYRFERNDNTTILLSDAYWSQAQSGLLSGEMLLGDLQKMELGFHRDQLSHARNHSIVLDDANRSGGADQPPAKRLLQFQHTRTLLRSVLPRPVLPQDQSRADYNSLRRRAADQHRRNLDADGQQVCA